MQMVHARIALHENLGGYGGCALGGHIFIALSPSRMLSGQLDQIDLFNKVLSIMLLTLSPLTKEFYTGTSGLTQLGHKLAMGSYMSH